MQGYYFSTNNPYREWPNAFAEGQEKAREGDLNAAVLLLEAAILQDPQDSEVTATPVHESIRVFCRSDQTNHHLGNDEIKLESLAAARQMSKSPRNRKSRSCKV